MSFYRFKSPQGWQFKFGPITIGRVKIYGWYFKLFRWQWPKSKKKKYPLPTPDSNQRTLMDFRFLRK